MSDAVGSGSVHVTVPVVPQFFEVSASLSLSLTHSLTHPLCISVLQDSGMKSFHGATDPVGYDIQGDSMQVRTHALTHSLTQITLYSRIHCSLHLKYLCRSLLFPWLPVNPSRPSLV